MVLLSLKWDFSKNTLEFFWYSIDVGFIGCAVKLSILCPDFAIYHLYNFTQSIFLLGASFPYL